MLIFAIFSTTTLIIKQVTLLHTQYYQRGTKNLRLVVHECQSVK
jgi:hypothetical protein